MRTTDSNHALPIGPNLLEQQFDQASAPNQIWVTDITYVPTDDGWLYVAAIKDLFTKKIVGWAMEDNAINDGISRHFARIKRTMGAGPKRRTVLWVNSALLRWVFVLQVVFLPPTRLSRQIIRPLLFRSRVRCNRGAVVGEHEHAACSGRGGLHSPTTGSSEYV